MESQFFGAEFENIWRECEAKQNDQGVIYYVNGTTQITSWDHPYFKKVLEELDVRYREIKYAAYRTSLKLRHLQSHIGLSWIQLDAIKQVFADCPAEDDLYLSYNEAHSLIQNVLHISGEEIRKEEDIQTATDLILNLMMSLYDVNRCGKMFKRSVRTALTTMCCARLIEKYRYFFASVRDENQNISREELFFLIDDLMQFPYIIKEGASFGKNVAATIESCFKAAGDSNVAGIHFEGFYSWLTLEPQTLVWLPTFHRILATETVQHNVGCSVCGSAQITGLRYRCLRCLKYELCQGCFLQGHTSLRHKLQHPVREYCLPTSIKDSTKALLTILKNKLVKRQTGQAKTVYLPVDASTDSSTLNDWQLNSIQNNSLACNSNSVDSGLAIGSDQEDVAISEQDDQLKTAEHETRAWNRTLQIIEEPCNTSSPLTGLSDQDFAHLSKRDLEIQQQQMLMKIEQLQRDNKILQNQLNTIYKYCDAELTGEQSGTEDFEAGRAVSNLSRDQLQEITDVPISPIVTSVDLSHTKRHLTVENDSSSSIGEQQIDICHIIGTFTPVGSASLNRSSPLVSQNQKSEQSKVLHSFIGHNDSSVPHDSQYQSIDTSVPFDSSEDVSILKTPESEVDGESLSESTLIPNQLKYKLSDMSLDFQDTIEKSSMTDAGLSARDNSFQLQIEAQSTNSASNLRLANGSVKSATRLNTCSVLSNKQLSKRKDHERQPCLILVSSSLKPKCERSHFEASSSNLIVNSETMSGCQNHFANKLYVQDNDCADLSEIIQHGQTLLHSNEPSPVHMKTAPRWKTIEPVHMSTPVNECKEHCITAPWLLKKHPEAVSSSKFSHLNNKENMAVTTSKLSQSRPSIDRTPLSSLSWHKKGILMSLNSLLSNHSLSSNNITEGGSGTGNLSNVFRKAEQIGNIISEGIQETMVTHERDELEKMMTDFEKECKSDDSTHSGMCGASRKMDDGSMLTAVQNIGDALTNFVYAAEQNQIQTENSISGNK